MKNKNNLPKNKSIFTPTQIGAILSALIGSICIGSVFLGPPFWVSVSLFLFGIACFVFSYYTVRGICWTYTLIFSGIGIIFTTPVIANSLFWGIVENIIQSHTDSNTLILIVQNMINKTVTDTDYFIVTVGILLIVIGSISQYYLTRVLIISPETHANPAIDHEENKNIWAYFINSKEYNDWEHNYMFLWAPPLNVPLDSELVSST